jgi:hypothetical protein
LVKIDVEGGELAVLKGMSDMPWILCEVLRRDINADPEQFSTRMRETLAFLTDRQMSVWRIDKSAERIEGFERIWAFPDEVYSPATREMNDYLFLPSGEEP